MAKKIRFPLVLAEGAQVRSMEELREHFDLEAVLGYYKTGKLLTWLEDRYLEGEAKAIRALDETAPNFQLRLCETLGVEYTKSDVDLEAIRARQERLARLRTITDEDEFLQNIDSVAFDQEELADLLDEERTAVYLCGERFTVPASRKGVTYVGINEPEVKISGELPANFDELGIAFCACKVDRPKPPMPAPLKQAHRVEVPQGAKIVATSSISPTMGVINGWQDIVSVACSKGGRMGSMHGVIGIKRDGSVAAMESYRWGDAPKWEMICSVAVGKEHIVGLQKNGTVVAATITGSQPNYCRVSDWTEITAVACGEYHTVGLRKNGRVVIAGTGSVRDWRDIVSIGCTHNATFGLKRDGTVVSTRNNYRTQIWTNIVSIGCGPYIIAGVKRDGTVVVDDHLQMTGKVSDWWRDWRDIISVACGDGFVAGLRRDNTVVVAPAENRGRIEQEVRNWKNVVSIAAGEDFLTGIVGPEG